MNLIENVKEIEAKYLAGQNIFRRPSVGFLLERISQLEQAAEQSVQPTVLCTCETIDTQVTKLLDSACPVHGSHSG